MKAQLTREQRDYLIKIAGIPEKDLPPARAEPTRRSPPSSIWSQPSSASPRFLPRLARALRFFFVNIVVLLPLLIDSARSETSITAELTKPVSRPLPPPAGTDHLAIDDETLYQAPFRQPDCAIPTSYSLPITGLLALALVLLLILARNARTHCAKSGISAAEELNPANEALTLPLEAHDQVKPAQSPTPTPLIAQLADLPGIARPRSLWDVAVATRTGNVRPANEDTVLAFTICGIQLLVLADGCGGTPYGGIASRAAVEEVARSISDDLWNFSSWQSTALMPILERAIYTAAVRLSQESTAVGMTVSDSGMRSTLIIIAGGLDSYTFGYIGDGGAVVLRANGQPEPFLTPQKAHPHYSNILAASLGPWIEGAPVLGSVERHPGELLIAGTDGVFDFVGPDFPQAVARVAVQFRGNLAQTADVILHDLASASDHLGWICSDNLSIGLMANAPLSPAILNAVPADSEPPLETPSAGAPATKV